MTGRAKGRKLALIIAIGNYPRASGYPRLGADHDASLIQGALRLQGFYGARMRILVDSQATRAGILDAFGALEAAIRPGDVVVVHYAGQAQQITDDNGDEPDGLDEALVPSDAWLTNDPRARGGLRHIRDDELESRLKSLRARLYPGGQLMVVLDASYSGRAGRSVVPVRGGLPPIGRPARTRRPGAEAGSGWIRPAPDSSLAPMVVFSAARVHQLAGEVELAGGKGTTAGALSLGMARVLANLDVSDGPPNYRALFEQLKAWMQGAVPLQTPQLEGSADALVFGGRTVARKPYVRVASALGDSGVLLDGGTLVGLVPGSRIAFFPLGTPVTSGANPLASGTVVRANELETEVRLDGAGQVAVARSSWAYVTEYAAEKFRFTVRLDRAIPPALRSSLEADFARSGVIQASDSIAEMLVRPAAGSGGALLLASWAQDTTIAVLPPVDGRSAAGRATLTERMRTLAWSRYLKQVMISDPRLRVRIELIPATHRFAADGQCDARQSDTVHAGARLSAGSQWLVRPRDGFVLRLVNDGAEPAYVAVLDLTPDGEITQLIPRPGLPQDGDPLPPGGRRLSSACFSATEPLGTEVLKLFATRRLIDFTPVLSGRQAAGGDEAPMLERLLGMSYVIAPGRPTTPGSGSTTSLTMQIVSPNDR
jgi:hypothetical protein